MHLWPWVKRVAWLCVNYAIELIIMSCCFWYVKRARIHFLLVFSHSAIYDNMAKHSMVWYGTICQQLCQRKQQLHSEGFGLSKHSTAQGMKKKTEKTVTTFIIVLSVCVLVFKHFFFSLSLSALLRRNVAISFYGKKNAEAIPKTVGSYNYTITEISVVNAFPANSSNRAEFETDLNFESKILSKLNETNSIELFRTFFESQQIYQL